MRYLPALLCALAVAVAQGLYGGAMRPVFALPAFALVGLAGVLGVACVFRGKTPPPNFFCLAGVVMLAGWLLWREFHSPDPWLAAGYLRLTLACLVVYLLFASVITNPYHRLAFVVVLLVLALIQSATAAWQCTHAHEGFPIPWLSEQLRQWYAPRFSNVAHGFYLNRNHLAWFLNAAGILALSLACWGRWGVLARVLCFYVALMSFAGSILAASRGGMISLGVGLTVFFLLSVLVLFAGVKERRGVALLLLVACLLATAGMIAWVFQGSFSAQERFDNLWKDSYRPEVFAVVSRQFQLDPLYGTGAGTFMYFVRQLREFPTVGDDFFAHNDWLQLAADFGFPALALLAAAVLLHGAAGLASLLHVLHDRMMIYSRPQSHAAALLVAALAILAVFAAHSFFDFNMQIPANALLASAFFGMLANPGVEISKPSAGWLGLVRRAAGPGLAAIIGVWLLLAVWRAAGSSYYLLNAENLLLAGDWEGGSKMARLGLTAGPAGQDCPELHAALGESFLLQSVGLGSPAARWQNYQLAAQEFSEAARLAPQVGNYRFLLARALMLAGRPIRAEEAILEAIRLNPGQGPNYVFYAQLLEQTGRLSEALGFYILSGGYGNPKWAADFDRVVEKIRRRDRKSATL